MLVGSLDFLRKEVKDWWKKLPAKYSSADEVAMAVFSIENADWSDDKETTEAMDMVHERFYSCRPTRRLNGGYTQMRRFHRTSSGCGFHQMQEINMA